MITIVKEHSCFLEFSNVLNAYKSLRKGKKAMLHYPSYAVLTLDEF